VPLISPQWADRAQNFVGVHTHTHTRSFIKKLSDATQHKVIDKIQSLCTKINTKVNVNNNPYNILIRKSRSDSSLDLVISDLLCERSLKL